MISNMISMKEHLKNYTTYLKDSTNEISQIVEKHNWKRQKTRIQTFDSVVEVKYQSKLEIPAMSSQKSEIIYCITAMALYKTGKAFCNFDDEDYMVSIYILNLVYKLSNT